MYLLSCCKQNLLGLLLFGGALFLHVPVFADSAVAAGLFEKEMSINRRYLLVPVKNSEQRVFAGQQILQITDGDRLLREFRVKLPENGDSPDWIAAYPVYQFNGETVMLKSSGKVPDTYSDALGQIRLSDDPPVRPDDYTVPYRDQFHFSVRRGWNNDVNGLVFNGGVYHLYYQYNPFNISWDNMHWGHATSTDLVHWEEQEIALFPNHMRDMMFSGGGFMDVQNTSGVGTNGVIPQFAAFTSTGRGECLAYSLDNGTTFAELPENPVVTHHGRDPKVIWHEPSHKWIMVVFDESDELLDPAPLPSVPEARLRDNMAFYSSADLRTWTFESRFVHPDRKATKECPELFEIPIEGRPNETRWILYGVENRYFIGHFDGHRFVEESGPFRGEIGLGRAAQIVSDAPDHRIIQVAWAYQGSPFYLNKWPDQFYSQGILLPREVSLKETPDGLRLFFYPVKEVDALRKKQIVSVENPELAEVSETLQSCEGKLLDLLIDVELPGSSKLELTVNGQTVTVQESGSVRVLSDRTITELFVNQGERVMSFRRPESAFEDTSCSLKVSGGGIIKLLEIYEMGSSW
jgi:fructan beta-fructosidase